MVLDPQGKVVLSTIPENEGADYSTQLFFRQGTLRFYIGFVDDPSFGSDNLIVAVPMYGVDGELSGVCWLCDQMPDRSRE